MSDSDSADGIGGTAAFETMVIRAWMDVGHDDPFRARLSFTSESGEAGSTIVTGAPQDVLDAVRDWLEGVQKAERRPQTPPPSGDGEQ